ncbi:MAG: DUF4450 domain-containing protein [Prolixibacteraceae bacterium]
MDTLNKRRFLWIARLLALMLCQQSLSAQDLWHNQSREMRYRPEGNEFVINNGTHRFNRALYGTNTAFRVETGDLPEFALYLPGMGGNLHLGLSQGDSSKWLTDFRSIEARYHAGSMKYRLGDPMLKKGQMTIQVLALSDGEGIILRLSGEQIPAGSKLIWAFGGVTGKKFSRDGDLGADPESSFYLKPEYCADNDFQLSGNTCILSFGSGRDRTTNEIYENKYIPTKEELEKTRILIKKQLFGLFPENSELKITDATRLKNPVQCFDAEKSATPIVSGKMVLTSGKDYYLFILNPETRQKPAYSDLAGIFEKADSARKSLAERIKIETPDTYINAVGASISTAADAVWDGQSYMHGAIAWRMPLNGWRGAYAADWLGWHDRAETHFNGYFKAQYTEPASGPSVPDSATNLARQKEKIGTALFTDGYISRSPGKINSPHHYDMNLVFIDQLLRHYNWTGDLDYLRSSWPVLVRHLAWEKRNFDGDNDGLYDAYCCIWASDALQYSGGGVTHSSAYNYFANKMAAELAVRIGKDPKPYQEEADKIKRAVNKRLWLPDKGWFAENADLLGNKLVHPSAALWTCYHAIDEGLADPFQAWQTTKYIDNSIPHIPIKGKGLPEGNYFTLSTSNWMPYAWSINNVASGEVLHTALAYWQAGRPEIAFQLTKGVFLDFMFLGSSPANFGQLSFYDAFRGELYRDFADAIGTASRALVEGLFGVSPDLLNKTLAIKPGWPSEWPFANLETPDLKIQFRKNGLEDNYKIKSNFPMPLKLKLQLSAGFESVKSVRVNGKEIKWKLTESSIGKPEMVIETPMGSTFDVSVEWQGAALVKVSTAAFYAKGEAFKLEINDANILKVYDPQKIFVRLAIGKHSLEAHLQGEPGGRSAFVQLRQGEMQWWQPITFELRNRLQVIAPKDQSANNLKFIVRNNGEKAFEGTVDLNGFTSKIVVQGRSDSFTIQVPAEFLVPGSNQVTIRNNDAAHLENVIKWNLPSPANAKYESMDLTGKFNDRITNIFKEQYFSPRSPYPTLAIPVQGIGDWCSFKETASIDDSGLRKLAGMENKILSPQGIPFSITGKEIPNIMFTSMWDNYPSKVSLTLTGKAKHLYLLMAGSGHHMQSRMVNGLVNVEYTDGTKEELPLVSPDNWWPIEQDFYEDGYAFSMDAVRPPRLYLKTGEWQLISYDILSKNKPRRIDGGAASILDLPLNPQKELKRLTLETKTNDVVIGLMAATLSR